MLRCKVISNLIREVNPLPPSDAVRKQKSISEDLFSLVLSQFKKYYSPGNLKFYYLGIFQSWKLRTSMENILSISLNLKFTLNSTTWVASPRGFSEMTIQPARHECHACCPPQAEKPGIQPVVGNMHDTHVEQVVSSFQKILRGSQLTWYFWLLRGNHISIKLDIPFCHWY